MNLPDWLHVEPGDAPLIVSFPHTGSDLPAALIDRFVSPWRARRDTDWWVDRLYDFARDLGATSVRTTISRSIIDVNRDPAGVSLYPGQATTGLCPLTTFDNEPLYRDGQVPDAAEIDARRARWFDPYHAALAAQIARLRQRHPRVVVYDAHSIRSRIAHLFDGELPHLNLGTAGADGTPETACAPELADAVQAICTRSGFSYVRNGRFKGGYITRHYGDPGNGVHTLQMELACRGYLDEPDVIHEHNWPPPYNPQCAAALREVLQHILRACLCFAYG